jgi:DNA-binding CsgD family transcriptional regulator
VFLHRPLPVGGQEIFISAFWDLPRIEAAFAAAAVDSSRWTQAMETAFETIPCTGAALMPVRVHFPSMPCSAGVAEASHEYLNGGWQSRDLRYSGLPSLFRTGVTSDLAFATPERLAKDPFYQELLVPYDCPWFAGIKVESQHEVRCLTFQRSAALGPFSEDELTRLASLSRSLGGSAALAYALSFAKAEAALASFEISETPVVLLNIRGEVLLMNPSATRLMGIDLKLAGGRLASSSPDATAALDRALKALFVDPTPRSSMPPVVLPRTGEMKRPLLAHAVRIPHVTADVFGAARGAVVMTDLERRPDPPEELLRSVFGLTAMQAKLARLVATGLGLETIGDQLGITQETVRSHLKQVYAKTDTHRQAELATMLSGMIDFSGKLRQQGGEQQP